MAVAARSEQRILVTELQFGDVVIYRHGDSIPCVSEGLEAYMQVIDQYDGTRNKVHLVTRMYMEGGITPEGQMAETKRLLAPDIPEWQ